MKHDLYIYTTGCEIDFYITSWRCKNCDAVSNLGVSLIEDQECSNTGAPDWKAMDEAERKAYFDRVIAEKKASIGLQDP